MSREKIQIVKKPKNDDFTLDNLQVKCENDRIKNFNLISDDDLKIFHDMYTKLNKLNKMHTTNEISYYITENDLNKISNDKIQQLRITTDKISHKSHNKKQNNIESIIDIKNDTKFNNIELESLLEKLNDDSNFNLINNKNIYYDAKDINEYDIFKITKDNNVISYDGMPKNSFDSFMLVNKNYIGKTINYDLNNEKKVLFLVYSKEWPNYTYPIYVIIRDYKFSLEKFITVFNNILNLIIK